MGAFARQTPDDSGSNPAASASNQRAFTLKHSIHAFFLCDRIWMKIAALHGAD
jgi:hypothetical protein